MGRSSTSWLPRLQHLRECRLLDTRKGPGKRVFQRRVPLRLHKGLGGDALHRLALLGVGEDGVVQLQDLLGRRRDGVDCPENLRPQLLLGEVVEVLHQHGRRGRCPDGHERLDGGQALRLLAPLHHLVEVRDGDLVAQGTGGRIAASLIPRSAL